MTTLEDLTEEAPAPGPLDWNDEGVIILKSHFSDEMIDAYKDEWKASNGFEFIEFVGEMDGGPGLGILHAKRPIGWTETAYMRYPSLMDLCTDPGIAAELEKLLGEPAGVHLNLTGWISTFRNWHQDTYLNPAHVGDYYAAVWIALDDVHPDAGPFQYVGGSHRWNRLTQEKIGTVVNLSDPMWPQHTEAILTPLVEEETAKRGAEVTTYLPKKGDVLIWHSRLYHRGSVPNLPGAYRGACIAHFSGINHRGDMPTAEQHPNGGWFFPIHQQAELSHSMMGAGN